MKGKHYKEEPKINKVLSILRLIFIVTLIISISYIVKWYVNNKQNETLKEKISEAIVIESLESETDEEKETIKYNVDFEKLKETNEDTVAWLNVNGTAIQYPVVQETDNSYYLKRNFNKKNNSAGWIFADYRNKLDGTDKNIIIYGHNRKDNSMFGTLKKTLNEDWYNNEENLIISLVTEKEEYEYKVFSIYEIQNEDYYIKTEFIDNEFIDFVEILKSRSIKDFGADVSPKDSILTLSTCGNTNKYRTVLHAKKMLRD